MGDEMGAATTMDGAGVEECASQQTMHTTGGEGSGEEGEVEDEGDSPMGEDETPLTILIARKGN